MRRSSLKWKEEYLREIIKSSLTKSEVLRKIGLHYTCGGNSRTLDKYIKIYNIDISHFKGQGWSAGKKIYSLKSKIPTDQYSVSPSHHQTSSVRKRIIKDKLKEYKCSECPIVDNWNNKPISLHLDHINGENTDNRLENLRFLCPNCHSQTETYCRSKSYILKKESEKNNPVKEKILIIKTKRIRTPRVYTPRPKNNLCFKCKNPCVRKFCSHKCSCLSHRNPNRPSMEILQEDIKNLSFLAIGRKYGVSNTAIKKWCKEYNIL